MHQTVIIDDDLIVRNLLPPPTIPKCSIAQCLSSKFLELGNSLALVDVKNQFHLTFADWYIQSKRFSSSLINFQLTKNDLVLLFGDNSLEYAITMVGVIWLGLTFSPITPANGPFELGQQIKDSQGSILIIDRNKLAILKSAIENPLHRQTIINNLKLIIIINSFDSDLPLIDSIRSSSPSSCRVMTYSDIIQTISNQDAEMLHIPHFPVNSDDFFVIIYTSGTTGLPKGAIHSNYSFLASLVKSLDRFTSKRNEFALWYPFGHVSGIFILLMNIFSGATNLLFSNNNLEDILSTAAKHRLHHLSISPEHASKMLENDYQNKYDLSCLKVIWCGGAKLFPNQIASIQKIYNVSLFELYGATEFMSALSHNEDEQPSVGSVGQPSAGIEVKIIHLESGVNLPAYQSGEICLRGPQKFIKYLKNEKATRDTIDPDGWYHSGDIGYYDENGALFIVDRIKELIKFRLWSISPSEIEDFMLRHPAVESVCVVGVKHKIDVNLLRAYVKLKDGFKENQVSQEELIKFVQDNMGFQKRLRGGVHFVNQMPRTLIGKVERNYFHKLVQNELLTEVVD